MSFLNQLVGACGPIGQQSYYAQQASQAQQQAAQNMSQGNYVGQTPWQAPKWMFNGNILSSIDMANAIWPDDCPDKTAFVLKYSE
jgi:delta 1-pyrroline-5-carboxylate dehydrogenase